MSNWRWPYSEFKRGGLAVRRYWYEPSKDSNIDFYQHLEDIKQEQVFRLYINNGLAIVITVPKGTSNE